MFFNNIRTVYQINVKYQFMMQSERCTHFFYGSLVALEIFCRFIDRRGACHVLKDSLRLGNNKHVTTIITFGPPETFADAFGL